MSDDAARNATDEETATFLPGLVLVDGYEVLTTLVQSDGMPEPRLAIHMKFLGRENKTEIRRVVNVVFSPEDAARFMHIVGESYAHAANRPRDSFGRPQDRSGR